MMSHVCLRKSVILEKLNVAQLPRQRRVIAGRRLGNLNRPALRKAVKRVT